MKLDLDLPKRDHVAIMRKSWGLSTLTKRATAMPVRG